MRTRRNVRDDYCLSLTRRCSEVGQRRTVSRTVSTAFSLRYFTHIPNGLANLSRIKSNSWELSSPSFRSKRGTGAVRTSCKWNAPGLRNGFGICNSHWLPRREVVWNITVTRSRSWSVGASVSTRQGRIFATYPASITQISPGCGLVLRILRFSPVNFLAGRDQKIISKFHFFLLRRQFKNPPANSPSFRFIQLWQFCNDPRCTHNGTVAESMRDRNPGQLSCF
jgi:hypothetical protein